MAATLAARQRACGLDRCGYSGGPEPEVRGCLFVPLAGPWWLGRGCAGRRRCGEGAVCVSAPLMVGAYGMGRRTPNVRSAPAHAVGPDHEWGTHTDRPFAAPPATGTPSSQPPRAGQRHKQAAPHLRFGPAGVAAPVQATCSLSGGESSRHPPTSARGHRTSSVGGILLPDPPS